VQKPLILCRSGSILEGPSTEKLSLIVDEGMPMFIALLKDESVVVRDTTAWAIGRQVTFLSNRKQQSLLLSSAAFLAYRQTKRRQLVVT